MKKMTFILLFLFCFFTVKSQTNIDVTYEYTFTPDSENKANKIKTENFILRTCLMFPNQNTTECEQMKIPPMFFFSFISY